MSFYSETEFLSANQYPMVYLDYAATTPADQSVVNIMTEYLGIGGIFGNPSSRFHEFGQMAQKAVEKARNHLADLISADPSEIIWTSGATESINLAIKGVAFRSSLRRAHIITSCIEHKAVLDSCAYLESQGFEITYVTPDQEGMITPEKISEMLRNDTILVTLMHVNNEIGTITNINTIGHITRERGITFHVDASQSSSRLPIDVNKIPADLISFSGHKMYGPKGVGALYCRKCSGTGIEPLMHGGGQEYRIRPGTLPTHQLVGMGEAARLAKKRLQGDLSKITALDKYLLDKLLSIELTKLNGNSLNRIPGILNVCFDHVENESLMMTLKDVAVSSGSACNSSHFETSHVLIGIGISEDDANCSVRFSIGRQTTLDDIDFAVMRLKKTVNLLRQLSPQWKSLNSCTLPHSTKKNKSNNPVTHKYAYQ